MPVLDEKVDPISLTQKQASYQDKAPVDACSQTQKLLSNHESMAVKNSALSLAKASSETDSTKKLKIKSYHLPYIKPLSSDK